MHKIALFANTAWYLHNHRCSLARLLKEDGMEVTLLSPFDSYVENLVSQGLGWIEIPMQRGGMNVFSELRTVLHCIQVYRKLRPDLVHHFTVKPVFYGSLAARITGVPAVVNSITGLGYLFTHRSPRVKVIRTMLKPITKQAMAHPNQRVIFQHEADLTAYHAMGLVRLDHAVIIQSSGVDLVRFQVQGEPDGIPVIVMAARMLWDKGVGDLVEVARQITMGGMKVRFLLVGEPDPGNPSSIPVEQLQAWHREGVIEWLGHRDEMPDILAQCHIVVLPTRYGEGVPKILIEAGAMGKAVVASNLPGCREVIRHEWNGLLIPAGDTKALSEALLRLIQDPDERKRMGKHGREMVEGSFDEEIVNRKTMGIYSELLEGSKRNSNE